MTFDLVAPVYDALARLAFGRALLGAQEWGVNQLPPNGRVLLLGGGTGATLPALLARRPRQVVYVEASEKMLDKARQRVSVDAPVLFVNGTEASVAADGPFDYVLLPFVLDVYPAETLQETMLPQLLACLRPGGQLLVTDFAEPRAAWQRGYMWLMLRFFRFTAQIVVAQWTNWPAALRAAGLTERTGCSFRWGQIRSGYWLRTGEEQGPTPTKFPLNL